MKEENFIEVNISSARPTSRILENFDKAAMVQYLHIHLKVKVIKKLSKMLSKSCSRSKFFVKEEGTDTEEMYYRLRVQDI